MATYRVWLTVKDSYGNTKELDGGTVSLDLDGFTKEELNQIESALPLDDYLKKAEIDTELDRFATDVEVEHAVQNNETIKYSSFF